MVFYSAKDYSISDLTHYVRLYVEDGVLKVCLFVCVHYILKLLHKYVSTG